MTHVSDESPGEGGEFVLNSDDSVSI
jgi:hypothetical protein